MASGSLARRYARALLAIGTDNSTYEALGAEVRALADAMAGSDELAQALTNPAFPRAARERVLTAVMKRTGASETVQNFARLLLDRERVVALPDIAREFDAMIDEQAGRISAEVTSAVPLTSIQLTELKGALEKLSGKQVQLTTGHDESLLGGVVAKVGDTVYDGSLRTQLELMQHELTD